MKKRTLYDPCRFLFSILLAGMFLMNAVSVRAGILYSDEELWAAGDLWKKTQAQWDVEKVRHATKMKKIKNAKVSVVETDLRVRQELKLHKSQSLQLARQRNDVQAVLIRETNARSSGGKYRTSDPVKATLGTGIDDPAYRGMYSDLDAQAGELTIEKMKGTLKDMGLDSTLKFKNNKFSPGTVEIEGDFDLCIHKSGMKAKVGDEFHKVLNVTDAKNPEVYLSERMRNRSLGTKNAGTDYVEVQDHLKKARKGHIASSKTLLADKPLIQKMAKGTTKTLEMGHINDDDLGEILQKNGIDDTPAKFREKLADIKKGDYSVKTSSEAAKIREASKDIFTKADLKTRIQAAKEFKAKRAELNQLREKVKKVDAMTDDPKLRVRKESLKRSLKERELKIREELIDSKVKMDASKTANDEFFADPEGRMTRGPDKVKKLPEPTRGGASGDVKKTPQAPDRIKTDVASGKVGPKKAGKVQGDIVAPGRGSKLKNAAGKGMKTFGNFMDIVDIGNACAKFQEYREGKVPLKDVIRAVVDMTPLGGVIGTGEKIATSAMDYRGTRNKIKEANETNMEAYLLQWEKQFRESGMSPQESRRYISAAVLGGNLEILEGKAELLRIDGNTIKSPKLIVEPHLGPDGGGWYMWENTKDLASGMWQSTVKGSEYIVYAPGRMVVAWSAGELKEATLDYDSKTATSDMKTRLFRKLLDAGIESDRALAAVSGSESMLKEVTREAQEKMKVIREEQAIVQAERDEFDQKLKNCMREISRLRFADASIKTTPTSPLKVPTDTEDDGVFPVVVSLSGSFTDRVGEISRMLEAITGTAPKVSYTYSFSVKSAKELSPSSWEVEVPGKPGNYPVKINLKVSITSFPGIYKPIHRTILRTVSGVIAVKPSIESIRFTESEYQLESGYETKLSVEVTNQADKGSYYYYWMIDGKGFPTEEPSTTYTPAVREEDCPQTIKASVALCDKESGCLLDEALADLHIIYPDKPAVDVWTVLKKTTEVSVSIEHLYSFHAKLGAAPVISYKHKGQRKVPDWNELFEDVTDVRIQMAADGKSIVQLEFEVISYWLGPMDPSKLSRFTGSDPSQKVARQLFSGVRYKLTNLKLVHLKDETSTESASASYRIRGEAQDCTFQEANEKDGQLVWGEIRPLGHLTSLASVYFSMSQEVVQKKVKTKIEGFKKAEKEEEKAVALTLGGDVYQGPFATDTPFKAKITINVGKDGRLVSGTFSGEAVIKKGKSKGTLEGEFTGTLNANGEFEARVSSGSITPWKKTKRGWYPDVTSTRSIPSSAKLVGKLHQDVLSGDMLTGKKRGFKWSATLVK